MFPFLVIWKFIAFNWTQSIEFQELFTFKKYSKLYRRAMRKVLFSALTQLFIKVLTVRSG